MLKSQIYNHNFRREKNRFLSLLDLQGWKLQEIQPLLQQPLVEDQELLQLDPSMVTKDPYNVIDVVDGATYRENVLHRKTWIGGGYNGLTPLQKRLQARSKLN